MFNLRPTQSMEETSELNSISGLKRSFYAGGYTL